MPVPKRWRHLHAYADTLWQFLPHYHLGRYRRTSLRLGLSANAARQRLRANLSRTLNESTPMKTGQYIYISLYGKPERVLVLAIHRAGTIDVQRSDGACYRVSGLSMAVGAGL